MFVPRFVLGNSYRFEWEKRSFGNFPSRERDLVLLCREIDGTIALSKERFLNSTFFSFFSRFRRSTLTFKAENSLFPLWWWRAAHCFRRDSENIFVNARRSWNHLFGNEIAPITHLMKVYTKCVKFELMCIKMWAKARDPSVGKKYKSLEKSFNFCWKWHCLRAGNIMKD